MVNIPSTLGALLVGGLVAFIFSGIVISQCFAYFKYYNNDPPKIKALVAAVLFLDLCHTLFVGESLWDYLIAHFGVNERVDFVSWSLPLTIAVTAALTFLVQCFFVHRIFKLSNSNYYITVPMAIIAGLRLCFACLTTVKMITLKSLEAFVAKYTWSFSLGLALSSVLDILTTVSLCYLFMNGRTKNPSLNHTLDKLMLYTFENGSLTCMATVTSMIFWLTMPTNLVFMGLHFVISKFYAGSLLATLNARKQLQHDRSLSQSSRERTPGHPDTTSTNRRFSRRDFAKSAVLQIKVEETMIRTVDDSTKPYAVSTYYSDSSHDRC